MTTTAPEPGASSAPAPAPAQTQTIRWDRLPMEILVRVMTGLDDAEAYGCDAVCRSWREASESDELWEPRCARRWRTKAGVTPGKLFRGARFREDVLANLSVKDMRQLLAQRGVDAVKAGFVEKAEYRAALAQTAQVVRIPRTLPALAGKWRASYAYAEVDSTSRSITRQELAEREWFFCFRENPAQFTSYARFSADGRLHMNPWPMQDPGTLYFTLQYNKRDGVEYASIQVASFPAHHLYRTRDWGWAMSNQYVVFLENGPNVKANLQEFLAFMNSSDGGVRRRREHDDEGEGEGEDDA